MRLIQLASLILAASAVPVLAGPCTQRVTDLEKALTARQEGSGPALGPATSGTPVNPTAEMRGHTQALQMLQEAKQLDQQGQEARCMDQVSRIEATMPK